MKQLFILLTVISLSLPLQARGIGNDSGGPKQSWQDILKNPKLQPAFPPVVIEGQMVSFNFLCLHDQVVRTQYKVKIVNKDSHEVTFKYLYENKGNGSDVINGQCYMEEIPRTLPIYVYAKKRSDSEFLNIPREVMFIKNFELPQCRADD